MKVFIGVPTAEFGRQAAFYDYVNHLIKPDGTIGNSFHTNSGARNRNLIIREALEQRCSHILFIDDDMAFPPDALMKLLAHDKDYVSGLFLKRVYPHLPIIFTEENGKDVRRHLIDGEHGLIEVAATGFGFTLVKTTVFSYLEEPFIRLGEIIPDRRSEDIGFCFRVKKAGFKLYCDLDCPIGHMGTAIYWPSHAGGHWSTAMDSQGDDVVHIPQITQGLLEELEKV